MALLFIILSVVCLVMCLYAVWIAGRAKGFSDCYKLLSDKYEINNNIKQ